MLMFSRDITEENAGAERGEIIPILEVNRDPRKIWLYSLETQSQMRDVDTRKEIKL